jgi:hypothetical protein
MNAVTFCTHEYAHFAEPWSDACREHGLTPHIIRRDSMGCYDRNTNLKPSSILRACEELESFAYFDIDCIPTAPFDFPIRHDIGTVRSIHPGHACKIASSLLFVGQGGAAFIRRWKKLCEKEPTRRDHPLLVSALSIYRSRYRIKDMTKLVAGKWAFNALNPDKKTIEA